MNNTWQFIQEKLNNNTGVMLLVVIENVGSSPGHPGFKMAVAGDGSMTGSIGGGQTEYRLVEKAKKELKSQNDRIFLKKEVHRSDAGADRSGMICSGEHWIAFYPIGDELGPTVRQINLAMDHNEQGLIYYNQNGFNFKTGESQHHQHKNPVTSLNEWDFTEMLCKENHLYIFGAGHVGFALSDIACKLGFVVHIFDNRKKINTLEANDFAKYKSVIDYKESAINVPDGQNTYAVIMTFGHKSDELVLRQLLNKDIRYLGMMGSDKKVNAIFQNLKNEGCDPALIKKVYAPIGIEIPSQTPYEIAISVVAEMIKVKNG
jgi:xanthine dehydrogenase accessory factor